jgi:hypothetical protein
MNFERKHFKMATKFKMAARHECFIIQSFKTLDLETSIHYKNIVEVIFFSKLQNGAQPFLNRF